MTEYKEGDTLTIVPRLIGSQTSKIRGELIKDRVDTDEWTIRPDGIKYAYDFNRMDWVIDSIERAPEPLPIERGVYASTRTDDGPLSPYYLDDQGHWHVLDYHGPHRVKKSEVTEWAPLKRLDVTS